MILRKSRFAATAAFAAMGMMIATPAYADGYGRRHHDHDIDAGDVIAGVLVLGAIAAIVGSGKKSGRSTPPPEPYRAPPPPRQQYRSDNGIDNAVGMCVDQVERGQDRVASVDEAARRADGWRVSGQIDQGGQFSCWIDNDGRIRSLDLGDGQGDYRDQQGASYRSDGNQAAPYNQTAYADSPAPDSQFTDDYYARARADLETAPADSGAIDADLGG